MGCEKQVGPEDRCVECVKGVAARTYRKPFWSKDLPRGDIFQWNSAKARAEPSAANRAAARLRLTEMPPASAGGVCHFPQMVDSQQRKRRPGCKSNSP